MWVAFVIGSRLCSERFFFGYSGFSLLENQHNCKFQFNPRMHGHFWTSSCELLGAPCVNNLHNRPFPSSLVPLFQSESKCKTIRMKMTLICMKMKLHAELVFIWKVLHFDSFWNRGTRELGNSLLFTFTLHTYVLHNYIICKYIGIHIHVFHIYPHISIHFFTSYLDDLSWTPFCDWLRYSLSILL